MVDFLWLGNVLGYVASGVISCVTIIGIPFGIQAFKFGTLALIPFGATVD